MLVCSGYIGFPYIIHLSRFFSTSLESTFCMCDVSHIFCCAQLFSVCFTMKLVFSSSKYIVYKCCSCFRQRRAQSFHRHTCIQQFCKFSLYNSFVALVTLFCCIIRTYLSHIFCCEQLVSVSVCFITRTYFLL